MNSQRVIMVSVYTLDEDEAVITRASDVTVGIFGRADLMLTNKNIVQINKGFWNEETGFEKYPLASLRIYNGKANIVVTKNNAGKRQVELYFNNFEKIYFFDKVSIENKWISDVKKAHRQYLENAEKARRKTSKNINILKALTDSAKSLIPQRTPISKTFKCKKCGAELHGLKGETIRCEYCNYENTIK